MAIRTVYLRELDDTVTVGRSNFVEHARKFVVRNRSGHTLLLEAPVLKWSCTKGVYLEDIASSVSLTDVLFTSKSYTRLNKGERS